MGGIHLAFDWGLLGPETACAQAASFAATTAFEASSARVVFARMFTPPDFRHLDNPTAPSDPFLGSFALRIAACPERPLLVAVRAPDSRKKHSVAGLCPSGNVHSHHANSITREAS